MDHIADARGGIARRGRSAVTLAGAMLVGIALCGALIVARQHSSATSLATGTGPVAQLPPSNSGTGTSEPACVGQVHWVGAWMAAPQDTSGRVPARVPDGEPLPLGARASFTISRSA